MASAASGSLADTALVSVALPIPVPQTFTYETDGQPPAVGARVLVPFGKGVQIGFVVGEGTPVPRVKRVVASLDDVPTVSGELLDLARWIADYYVAPLGQVLRAVVPGPLMDRSRDHLVALRPPPPDAVLSDRESALLSQLGPPGEGRSARAVRRALGGRGSFWPLVRRLQREGLVGHVTVPPKPPSPLKRRVLVLEREVGTLQELDEVFGRSARQREAYARLVAAGGRVPLAALLDEGFSRSVVNGLVGKGLAGYEEEEVLRDPFAGTGGEPGELPPLTGAQSDAIRGLEGMLSSGRTALLHGVTGSGKTRVYVEILRRVVDGGGGGIVLVPEISLTPQTVQRFRQAFGDSVSVLHSGLSDGERFDAWRSLREGRRRVAIGARSAVFAPVRDLGVIIVDEEHDGSYKQSDAPRYHARDVAVVRARRCGALCVLGSATPSLESWVNATTGKYEKFDLPDRVGGGSLPDVRVVDLRSGAGRGPGEGGTGAKPKHGDPSRGGSGRILSDPLREALAERLRSREQSVVLLNRRGYASFALCQECGDVMACPHCSVSMTFHRGRRLMLCHHCGHAEAPPKRCPRCGSEDLSFKGLGTEQVERVLMESFPEARIARMDVDTTGGKWSHQEILDRVGEGAVDILLGTQMIAKGLDFPRVTLVGVVNADVGLHLPDFRAAERTFQLLAQVAGRAGRGVLGGEVIIQTYVPEHYVIRAAVGHDYLGFVQREVALRRDPPYPPHLRMARVLLSSPVQSVAMDASEALGAWLSRHGSDGVAVLGPAPAPIERLHRRYRWHVLLRGGAQPLGQVLRRIAAEFSPSGSDVRLAIDRDPVHLL